MVICVFGSPRLASHIFSLLLRSATRAARRGAQGRELLLERERRVKHDGDLVRAVGQQHGEFRKKHVVVASVLHAASSGTNCTATRA